MSKEGTRPRALVGEPHAEDGIKRRPAPYPAAQGEQRDMARLSRWLHQDAAQLRQWSNCLACQVGYALHLLHSLVDGRSALEFHRLGRGIPLAFQPREHGGPARGEKGKYIGGLLLVPLVRTALVAG